MCDQGLTKVIFFSEHRNLDRAETVGASQAWANLKADVTKASDIKKLLLNVQEVKLNSFDCQSCWFL